MTFLLYLRYEMFNMLDRLSLMNVFKNFAFCTRACDLAGICTACTRLIYKQSYVSQKFILMFSTVKLLDLCSPSMAETFKHKRYWSQTFDICNLNDKFICIMKCRKQGCMFFKTCKMTQVCMAFIEILLRLYLNITKNIYDLLTKKYEHQYCLEFFHEECFSQAYRLMYLRFCVSHSLSFT